MSIWFIFITSFLVALSGALMPGPLLTVTIAYSARRGTLAGPLVVLGHSILELLLLFLILLGLEQILKMALFLKIVSMLGGVILLLMGIDFIRSFRRVRIRTDGIGERPSIQSPVLGGILISLSNPYWILWWVTIGLAYMTQAMKTARSLGLTAFFFGHILADLVWYTFVAFTFSHGRRFIRPQVYHLILLLCGIFLLLFGLFFLYSAIK